MTDTKALLTEAQQTDAVAVIRAIARTCRGALSAEARAQVNAHLQAGDQEAAKALDSAARPACGADLNPLIEAGPWDGDEHEGACPGCGNVFSYRAPTFETD